MAENKEDTAGPTTVATHAHAIALIACAIVRRLEVALSVQRSVEFRAISVTLKPVLMAVGYRNRFLRDVYDPLIRLMAPPKMSVRGMEDSLHGCKQSRSYKIPQSDFEY